MSLPGGYVHQTGNTCFITVLSMLTGIDVELFPQEQTLAPGVWAGGAHRTAEWVHVEIDPEDFKPWVALLRDNGFYLNILQKPPAARNYGVLTFQPTLILGHVLAMEDGLVVDPAWPFDRMPLSDYTERFQNFPIGYIVVTPMEEPCLSCSSWLC